MECIKTRQSVISAIVTVQPQKDNISATLGAPLMIREHYTVDLKTRTLEIRTYTVDLIKADLKLLGLKKPMDMDLTDTFNTKIFETEKAAEKWIKKYLETKEALKESAKSDKALPKMLCKQRYIVLSKLGEKNFTRRRYKKKWNIGDKFQLYDQRIFLTVELTKMTDTKDGFFTYEYKNV